MVSALPRYVHRFWVRTAFVRPDATAVKAEFTRDKLAREENTDLWRAKARP